MIRFFIGRGRALTVMFFSLLAILIFAIFTVCGTVIFDAWGGIILGLSLMLVALLFHALVGARAKIGYLFSFLLNTIGTGFNASAYYNCKNVNCDIVILLRASAVAVAFLVLLGVLLTIFKSAKHSFIAVFGCLEIAVTIMIIIGWVKYGGEYFAFALFSMAICIFNTGVYAFTVDEEERGLLRDISFGAYGYLIAVALIVIAVISSGEICDGCDCSDTCDCGGSGKKSKNKK